MQTLRLFADVARCHSFSEAAAQHGITQSAASQRIGALEKRLGVQLLDRSVRPLALTEAGQQFFDGCAELIQQYDELERRVVGMQGEPEGTVRVSAIYSAGIELLNFLREQFEQTHPRIAVELRYDQPEAVYGAVREFECDLGIVSYPDRWPRTNWLALRDEVMAVICRPDHPLARRQRVHAGDLSPYEMVSFDLDLPVARQIRRFLRDNGGAPRVTDSFDNIDTIKSAVAVTQRFAILPQRTVSREIAGGALTAIPLEPTLVRPLGILFRRRHRQAPVFSPAAQQFVDYLLEHAGPNVDTLNPDDSGLAPPIVPTPSASGHVFSDPADSGTAATATASAAKANAADERTAAFETEATRTTP